MIRVARWLLAMALLGAGAAGVALHLTVRDATQSLAPFFYMLPLPVAGAACLGSAVLFRVRFVRRVVALGGFATLGWWFWQSYGWAYPVKSKWKAVTWNIARPAHPFAPLVSLVRAERPDVMVLIESGDVSPSMVAFYERSLPGYRMVAGPMGIACLVRGRFAQVVPRVLVNGSDMISFRVMIGEEVLNVCGVDLQAAPFLPRRPQMELLAELIRGRRRTVVMGDFNAPLESVYLWSMRGDFTEARDGPHRGFLETWPYNVPLLSLDQIWCSRDLRPVFASRRFTFASDHAPLVLSFDPAE